jgi:hypothetical protein
MKTILFAFLLSGVGCKCSKTNNTKANIASEVAAITTITDTIAALPFCIRDMIAKMKAEPVTNPPNKIYCYTLNKKTVYYVPGPCCDNFSDLYDDSCRLIGHPDGGFTG